MKGKTRFIGSLVTALSALLLLSGCEQDEVRWETATSAVGAESAEQESFDKRWRSYRGGAVSGLDVMTRSLESARRQTSVADHAEVDALMGRVTQLRADMVGEIDTPSSQAAAKRAELEASFDSLRSDVESLLVRLGHSPEEFSAWRSVGS